MQPSPAHWLPSRFLSRQASGTDSLQYKYRVALRYQDLFLERLFKQLDDTGLSDNSYVVVVGDHGEVTPAVETPVGAVKDGLFLLLLPGQFRFSAIQLVRFWYACVGLTTVSDNNMLRYVPLHVPTRAIQVPTAL